MEAIPIVAFWCTAAWTLFRKKQALIYLFFAALPFGSFAAIPTAMTGGLTITPATVAAMLLIFSQLGNGDGMRSALALALKPSGLLLLFLFWLVAGITTAFMPRFFSGSIEIVPVRFGTSADTTMLFPTAQNFSQFVYISISVLTVFAFAKMLQADSLRIHAISAVWLGASLTVVTGLLDFASQYFPLQTVLEPFRTASYALVLDDEILNNKRVIGLMPEASSFGSLALAFLALLYFCRRVLPIGHDLRRVTPILITSLLLLVWLSTSSSAYLGLGLFVAMVGMEWVWRLAAGRRNPYLRRGIAGELLLGALGIGTLLLIVISVPEILNPMRELLDLMVLQKTNSSSYVERSMWTRVSLDALLATYGMGVGLGGSRASNFAVTLASNAGILGALLYFLFVFRTLIMRKGNRNDPEAAALFAGIRWSYFPPFFVSLTVATTPDFGIMNAFLYGFAVALTTKKNIFAGNRLRFPAQLIGDPAARSLTT